MFYSLINIFILLLENKSSNKKNKYIFFKNLAQKGFELLFFNNRMSIFTNKSNVLKTILRINSYLI